MCLITNTEEEINKNCSVYCVMSTLFQVVHYITLHICICATKQMNANITYMQLKIDILINHNHPLLSAE